MTAKQRRFCQFCKKPFATVMILGLLSLGLDTFLQGTFVDPVRSEAAAPPNRILATVTEIDPPRPDLRYHFQENNFTSETNFEENLWKNQREKIWVTTLWNRMR